METRVNVIVNLDTLYIIYSVTSGTFARNKKIIAYSVKTNTLSKLS